MCVQAFYISFTANSWNNIWVTSGVVQNCHLVTLTPGCSGPQMAWCTHTDQMAQPQYLWKVCQIWVFLIKVGVSDCMTVLHHTTRLFLMNGNISFSWIGTLFLLLIIYFIQKILLIFMMLPGVCHHCKHSEEATWFWISNDLSMCHCHFCSHVGKKHMLVSQLFFNKLRLSHTEREASKRGEKSSPTSCSYRLSLSAV